MVEGKSPRIALVATARTPPSKLAGVTEALTTPFVIVASVEYSTPTVVGANPAFTSIEISAAS